MKTKLYTLITLLAILTSQMSAQNTELWGTTRAGGNSNNGTIFKTDANGDNHTVVYSFPFSNEGGTPQYTKLCKASNGKLYGMTYYGGTNNEGVIFSYNPITEIYNKEFDFDGINSGKWPQASLIEANDGKLYGMTSQGGTYNYGILFSFDPTTLVFSKKIDFDGANKGRAPYGSLVQASNGKLYGMTLYGGTVTSTGYGVLFEYDPINDIFVKKVDFDGVNKGRNPYGSILQASNGKLYGMTNAGGANNLGIIFSFDLTASTFTNEIDFDGTNNGGKPYGSLIQANDGKLYSMTYYGGINNLGILFSYDYITSNFVKELDFDLTTTGGRPTGDLMQLNNGKLYGMNSVGGSNNKGVLFSYNPNTATFSNGFDFDGTDNGQNPSGSLITGNDGNIYGLTSSGGAGINGVLFKYDPILNNFEKKIDLNYAENGRYIYGGLLEATNGFLYGMTNSGGANDLGVLFSINPVTYKVTKEFDFDGTNNGSRPYGNLIEANNGKLYGMTYQGGTNNHGVIFEYNPLDKVFNKLVDFNNSTIGGFARGSLMQSSNGKLYGLTTSGGANSSGVLFEYEITTNTYIKKIDFNGTNGSGPNGSLIEASNGKFYGLTSSGGANSRGTLFEYDYTTNGLTVKRSFSSSFNGYYNPRASLIEASDGTLYGTLYSGGSNSSGGMFKYSLGTNSYTSLYSYSTNGKNPSSSLMQANNGKFYGVTRSGGNNGLGVLLEYDSSTNTFTKKLDFDGTNGSNPENTSLIEIQKPVVWTTANEWSNVVGPTIDDVTIIEGDLAVGTDFGDFSAKSLTIRAGGSLIIESGHVVTVNAHITNLATEADFVVESGANLVQLKDYQNEGSATVKRESAPIVRLDYTAWGAPVEGQNLLDFSPQTLPNRFYTYDYTGTTTATAWIPVADPSTTNFEPSHGYLLRAPNTWSSSVYTPFQGEFVGKPNNGSFQNTVGVGYNLLGNPYPSPLSADAFLTANAALGASSLYYWTHAVPQNGAYVPQTNYASYNLSGGTAAIAGGAQPDEFIQVGQGFLVNIAIAGQAQFTNAQRSDSSNNQFFKTTTTDVDRFWLGLRNDNASYNQILVAYVNGATNGIDLGYDAKLLTNGNSHLSSLINNENYVIQGRNSVFEVNDEVPLSFTAEQSGMFTISLDAVEGIFDSQDILLWDKQLNIYHNLQTNDYSFTTNAGTFNNRFSVVYNSTLSNPTFNEAAILVYKNNEYLIISSNNETLQNVKVYDIQGRLLVEKNDVNASSITVSEIKAKNQVLLVAIQTDNGSVTKKIGF